MADNKADVKAIMARFQGSGGSIDETASTPGGRLKQPLHQTLSSGSAAQKKAALESLPTIAMNVPPKPSFLKPTISSKSEIDQQELSKTKSIASRFANPQDDTNNKAFMSNKPLKPELKPLGPKPPLNKPSLSSTMSESKPVFPKPSLATGSKPNWVKDDSGGSAAPNTCSIPPKVPSTQSKPTSSFGKLKLLTDEAAGPSTDTVKDPSSQTSTLKPTYNFRTAQNMFNKDKVEQVDISQSNTQPVIAAKSIPPPKPLDSKKPSLKKPPSALPQSQSINGNAASGPKRKPLRSTFNSGPPAKPSRPPNVTLEKFRRKSDSLIDGSGFKKPTLLPPMTTNLSNHGNHGTAGPPIPPAVPSLPPRHPGTMNSQEDFYDDVEGLKDSPPPLPPSTGHPSQRANDDDHDSDGETYEDLDERWEAAEQKQEKEKAEKEEKKRLEAEKKEQKEREKKEQETRKKFKLVGPIEVIHQGKARFDCKGNKTDLALKQGDSLDIIRVQGNPEGKWLGRTSDGSIGYVKTTSVEIDFNTLKNRQAQQSYEPALYNDVDVVSSGNSGISGPGAVTPLLQRDGEIYDDCVDPNLEIRLPPTSQFMVEGSPDQLGGAIDEQIYDDVDSQIAPLPPPISSLPGMKVKGRNDEVDPKRQKKFEKEEKEFRKKFKYDGEIQPLYQVTIIHTLNNKKWSNKELSIKAGEKLDVIVKAVDDKLICRNEDGKFGYVSTSHIAVDDSDIYDDVGDDCIYDND